MAGRMEPLPQPDKPSSIETAKVALVHAGSSRFNERWLVQLRDGAQVECVLYRGDTLCVSSQVGCAVRCPFCASGARGLSRGLELDELIGQVEAVGALGHTIARVTVSGVGEPLHNHEAVRAFVDTCHARGIGPSLTTSGGPLPRLREWLHAPHNGLTLSVHAGSEAVRARLVPKGPPLDALFDVLREELPRMTRRRRRKTALAYLLIGGENDTDCEIDAFVERAVPLGFKIHLYAYNEVPTSVFARLSRERYAAVYARMVAAGLRVRMSSQARIESNGGCGTLVALHHASRSARAARSAS
jgi:23S rRNA (adenine2503-C2)-methyltransferase